MEQLDLQLGLDVDLIVRRCLDAIDILLPVLAHHDERSRIGRLEGQGQVQQDEWIRIPTLDIGGHVEGDPEDEDRRLDDDEAPRAHGRGDKVGNALASRQPRWPSRCCALPILPADLPQLA